jgi:hypothetical protein
VAGEARLELAIAVLETGALAANPPPSAWRHTWRSHPDRSAAVGDGGTTAASTTLVRDMVGASYEVVHVDGEAVVPGAMRRARAGLW